MKPPLQLPSNLSTRTFSLLLPHHLTFSTSISPSNSTLFLNPRTISPLYSSNLRNLSTFCSLNSSTQLKIPNSISQKSQAQQFDSENQSEFVEIKNPNVPPFVSSWRLKLSLSDQAFFLLTFIACTTSVAFVSFVAAAVPTLYAMGRAANSFAKLADTAREELPSTMAAIRLSGIEISDLTVELSDLSQEISEGVNKSAEAVQAAKHGMRQIGSIARDQTMSMIEERANLPAISLQPVVSGAAKKTSRAVGHATRALMNLISRGGSIAEDNK
ncbi:uncharacterized protein LOC110708775 [Chenopodium quinoa]|uniref:uncharacterized protein LOC110708775 n=1 Tax=Chenopodium quinoa TaxID=63459 RepID=UPI000B796BB0|nr:uncharacterized protein LOC110708775 [Chenopodium quinoa]